MGVAASHASQSALAGFHAWVLLVDDEGPATSANNLSAGDGFEGS